MEKVTPTKLKALRIHLKLSQAQCAEQVHVSVRQWAKYESNPSTASSSPIPEALYELFCLKNNIQLAVHQSNTLSHNKLAKVISFFSVKGGVGKTLLTVDIARLLEISGYKVLIICSEFTLINWFVVAQQFGYPFPRVIDVEKIYLSEEEDKRSDSEKKYGWIKEDKFSFLMLKQSYDFILIDINRMDEYRDWACQNIDFFIIPTFLSPDEIASIEANLFEVKYRRKIDVVPLIEVLIINKRICNPYPAIDTSDLINEKKFPKYRDSAISILDMEQRLYEALLKKGLPVFNSFTTEMYEIEKILRDEQKIEFEGLRKQPSIVDTHPLSWAVKELIAIKNEILQKLNMQKNSFSSIR